VLSDSSGTEREIDMVYKVTARLKPGVAGTFLARLTDGTIAAQKPDGQEMVDSMGRAVIDDSGDVAWSEVCYCPTPLAHERQTVLDNFFDDLTTQEIDAHEVYVGRPLMAHLEALANEESPGG